MGINICQKAKMSIKAQYQMKQNAEELRGYFKDLKDWTADIENMPKKQSKKNNYEAPIRGSLATEEEPKKNLEFDETRHNLKDPKRVRDRNTVKDYYDAWDKFDPEKAEQEMEDKT